MGKWRCGEDWGLSCCKRGGSVLIFSLWALTMLVIFASVIGMTIRQRIQLAARVESGQHLRDMVTSGIKKGIAALEKDIQQQDSFYTVANKIYRHNNRQVFQNTPFGSGMFQIFYPYYDGNLRDLKEGWGLIDEESKLNINFAKRDELLRLVRAVTSTTDDEAARITDGILGWRSFGDAGLDGFYSQEYYENLDEPYSAKGAEFEVFDEIRLVQGVTPRIYQQLLPYITIFGDGLVNINNAFPPVLIALGLDDVLVDKILETRRGLDGVEATDDDHVFLRTYDIATEVNQVTELKPEEIRQIDLLNAMQKIKTESSFFRIQSRGILEHRLQTMEAMAVYNAVDRWLEYYLEK